MKQYHYNFKLKPGRDDELINWIESKGEGERSFFLRDALRAFLGGKISKRVIPSQLSVKQITAKINLPMDEIGESFKDEPRQDDLESKLDKLGDLF